MDTPLLARYPFLPQARELVQTEGPNLGKLMESHAYERARRRGRERVRTALDSKPAPEGHAGSASDALLEVLGYVVARLIVSCVDDSLLTNRFALAEAERLKLNLDEDPDALLVEACRALSIPVERVDEAHEEAWGVPFDAYLKASRKLSALDWKLVNRTMDEGTVLLSRGEVTRLAQEALRLRLQEELPLDVPSDVRDALAGLLDPVKAQLADVREGREEVEMDQVEPEAFPPCMNALIQSIHAGENVSHEGRFAIVAFLNKVGMDQKAIIDELFPHVPDFARDVTEYQVEHITGEKNAEEYTPPSCSSMQTYGICPMMGRGEDEWDDWCAHEKMNHPLTYYRWGLFVQEKRAERGDGSAEGDEAEGAATDDEAADDGEPT